MILRTRAYLTGRSLWHDEAALARNIVDRSFIGLARPLDMNQGAPLGFLWVEKFLLLTLGKQDYWLRLFPFLAGIGSLVLMLPVARRYTRGAGVPIAFGLFALSGAAIYYSSEAKQYSTDSFVAVILLLGAYPCFTPRFKKRHWLALSLIGAACLWLSYPAAFILPSICLALLADLISRREWTRFPWIIGLGVFWSINTWAIYWISLRHLVSNLALVDFWEFSYPPSPFWLHMGWFADRLPVVLHNITGVPVLLGAALWILGGISMLRRTPLGLILLIPPLAALAAAAIRSYPFYDRFLLFALPGVCLFVGEGVESIRGSLARQKPALGLAAILALAVILFYYPVSQAWQNFRQPDMVEHLKPVLAYVQHFRRPGETIYVYYGAQHAFIYYAEQFGIQEGDYFLGLASRRQPDLYLEQLDGLKGNRIWFVFSHNCYWCQVDEQAYIIDRLDAMGTRLAETHAPKAAGYLYDLN
jgi:uncharacterized membrane protein